MASSRVFGMVLAGGEGKRLAPLTADRAKPAVPFGGNYRLIDFALSNLVNAGLRRIVVLTQYKSHSLDRHLAQTWALSPLLGNYVTPVPAQMRHGPRWFLGSADAIFQNLNLIYDERPEHIIVFGADHIYRMDPGQMIDQHVASGAGVTVAGIRTPIEQADQFGVIETTPDGKGIAAFREKPKDPVGLPDAPDEVFASMGNYIFTHRGADRRGHDRRRRRVLQARPRRQHHPVHGRPQRGGGLRLRGERGARRDRPRPRLLARRRDARRLLRRAHGPHLGPPDLQPLQPRVADPHAARAAAAGEVRLRRGRTAAATPSTRWSARASSSPAGRRGARVLSPGVHLHSYALVEDSILMQGVRGRAHARSCAARSSTRTCGSPRAPASGSTPKEDRERFHVSAGGVVVVGKGEVVAA